MSTCTDGTGRHGSILFADAFKPFCTKIIYIILTHYQTTNLDSSKLKEFADDNFKFNEYGRKLSKKVENTVGKGEIARYEQFLLFPTGFSKGFFPRGVKRCHCVGMG